MHAQGRYGKTPRAPTHGGGGAFPAGGWIGEARRRSRPIERAATLANTWSRARVRSDIQSPQTSPRDDGLCPALRTSSPSAPVSRTYIPQGRDSKRPAVAA